MIIIMKGTTSVTSRTKLLFSRLDSNWHNLGFCSGSCSFPYVRYSKNILLGVEQTVLVFATLPRRGLVIGPWQNTRPSARPKYFMRGSEPACWHESSKRYITSAKRCSLNSTDATEYSLQTVPSVWDKRSRSVPASYSGCPGFILTQKLILAEISFG
jgi:hypothetical protein